MASFSDALTQEADLLLDEFGVEGDDQPYGRLENTRIDDDLTREANRYLDEVGVEEEPQATLPSIAPEQPVLTERDEQAAIPRPTDLETMENLAATGGETGVKEQMLMGLINEDPELQVLYLRKQGFNTRIGPNGQAEYEQAEGDWRPALEGITQYWPNIVEGVVGALATGAKAVGAVGAPATGGASIAAAAGLGAAAGGALEGLKQGAAYAAGLREEADPGRVAEKAAVMGVGAAGGEMLGRGLSSIAGKTGKALEKKLVGRARSPVGDLATKEQVSKAAELLEVVPTPGMMTTNESIRNIEAAMDGMKNTLGGSLTRARATNIRRAIDEVSKEIVDKGTLKTPAEVGQAFKEKVTADIAKKLEPAEKIYKEIQDKIGEVAINKKFAKEKFTELYKDALLDGKGEEPALVKKVYQTIRDQVRTVDQLKETRSKFLKSLSRDDNQNIKEMSDRVYDALTEIRSNAFESGLRNSKGQFLPQKYKEYFAQLKEADKIWRDVSQEVSKALGKRGEKVRFGPKGKTARVLDVVPEKVLDKFLPRGDAERAAALKNLSEEGFQELVTARIAEMAKKATLTGSGKQGRTGFGALSREIRGLSPEIAKATLGENTLLKQQAAEILFRNLPFDINPSGTQKFNLFTDMTVKHLKGLGLTALHAYQQGNPYLTKQGKAFLKSLTKAGLITGASVGPKGLMKAVEQDANNKRDQK